MVDHTPRYRPYDLDVDIHDKALTDRRVAPYKFEPSVRFVRGRFRPRVSVRLRR